ncbi:MAG: hypothetical protein WDZ94_01870 [Patescibacteria group bacterium]
MSEKKLVAFEGIPGGGKTSVFHEISRSMPNQFTFIPELVKQFDPLTEQSIDSVLENDQEKYRIVRLSELSAVMDRSFVSTLNWEFVLNSRKNHNRSDGKTDRINEMISKNELWPANYYFFFDISPKVSITRKRLPKDEGLAWSTEESLAIAIAHYYEYFQKVETQSKVIIIDAEEALNVVLANVANLLSLVLKEKI